jgi:hypothetical protein
MLLETSELEVFFVGLELFDSLQNLMLVQDFP